MSYFFLIPVSIGLGLTGLCAFFWAMRHDQYDDLSGAAARILIAPDKPITPQPADESSNGKLVAVPGCLDPEPDRRLSPDQIAITHGDQDSPAGPGSA